MYHPGLCLFCLQFTSNGVDVTRTQVTIAQKAGMGAHTMNFPSDDWCACPSCMEKINAAERRRFGGGSPTVSREGAVSIGANTPLPQDISKQKHSALRNAGDQATHAPSLREPCKGCGRSIVTSDFTCPHCGYTQWRTIMGLGISSVAVLAGAFFGYLKIENAIGRNIVGWGGGILGGAWLIAAISSGIAGLKGRKIRAGFVKRLKLGTATYSSCGAPIEKPQAYARFSPACVKIINEEPSGGGMARLAPKVEAEKLLPSDSPTVTTASPPATLEECTAVLRRLLNDAPSVFVLPPDGKVTIARGGSLSHDYIREELNKYLTTFTGLVEAQKTGHWQGRAVTSTQFKAAVQATQRELEESATYWAMYSIQGQGMQQLRTVIDALGQINIETRSAPTAQEASIAESASTAPPNPEHPAAGSSKLASAGSEIEFTD